MAKGVTFDYSKTSLFISADEVELMKKTGWGCQRGPRQQNRSGK